MKKIEPQAIKEARLNKIPLYYQSMANNPLKDRLGSKTTYSGYLKIVNQKEIVVTVPATTTVTTTIAHGVSSSLPFVFLYLKTGDYYTRVGFRTSSDAANSLISGIGNAVIDEKNFSFGITNFSAGDVVYNLKALVFEVNN